MFQNINVGVGLKGVESTMVPYGSGLVSYDHNMRKFVLVDPVSGSRTDVYPNFAMIELSDEVQQIVQWAKKKMEDDIEIERLCQLNPSLKEAKDVFEMLKQLCR